MATTYTQLVNDILGWKANDAAEYLAAIPTFVDSACRTIAGEIDSIGLKATASVSTSSGKPEVTLPSDCYVLKTVTNVSAHGKKQLKMRPYDYITEIWPDYTSIGPVKYYNRNADGELYLGPTPGDGTLEIRYVTVSVPTSANPNCYLLDKHPNLLLYRSLVEANAFLMDWDDVAKWQALYDRERDTIENEGKRQRRDDGTGPNPINQTSFGNNLKNGQ